MKSVLLWFQNKIEKSYLQNFVAKLQNYRLKVKIINKILEAVSNHVNTNKSRYLIAQIIQGVDSEGFQWCLGYVEWRGQVSRAQTFQSPFSQTTFMTGFLPLTLKLRKPRPSLGKWSSQIRELVCSRAGIQISAFWFHVWLLPLHSHILVKVE